MFVRVYQMRFGGRLIKTVTYPGRISCMYGLFEWRRNEILNRTDTARVIDRRVYVSWAEDRFKRRRNNSAPFLGRRFLVADPAGGR